MMAAPMTVGDRVLVEGMAGEIALQGLAHSVGGIKEKCMAAHRNGIKNVILPKQNEKDLKELPDYRKS